MSAERKYDRDVMVPAICLRLATGKEPMTVICADLDVPVKTVNNWRQEDAEIALQFDEARDMGYDAIAADCIAISDTPIEGEELKYDNTGALIERKVGDMLGHRKLQIETRMKLLAKWDPRRYGDKQQLEHSGPGGGPIQTITSTTDPIEAARIYQEMMKAEA